VAEPDDQGDDGRSVRLQIFVDHQTVEYLRDLAKTGTYGRKHTRVAKTLIEEGVRRAIRDRLISAREFED